MTGERYGSWLTNATRALLREGVPDARVEAEALLLDCAQLRPAALLLRRDEFLPEPLAAVLQSALQRRLKREPLSQIVGYRDFWSAQFRVSNEVLTPRQETELLVEEALRAFREYRAHTPEDACPLIVDIGTGSGCIALSLALELQQETVEIIGVDRSSAALRVAIENRAILELSVALLEGDLLAPIEKRRQRPAIIVSNPPYITSEELETLEPEVRLHEPLLALDGGADGLRVIERLAQDAKRQLLPGGWLLFEMGWQQREASTQLLKELGFEAVHCVVDFSGHPRVMRGRQPSG